MSKTRIKVRFNLGRGVNYMKWKVQHPSGEIQYYSPDDVQLVMKDCILKNSRKTALKIYQGDDKTVCAWILCKDIEVKFNSFEDYSEVRIGFKGKSKLDRLMYNPRVVPYWTTEQTNLNMDGCHFNEIGSLNRRLFIL